jgi:hypothetical protein
LFEFRGVNEILTLFSREFLVLRKPLKDARRNDETGTAIMVLVIPINFLWG